MEFDLDNMKIIQIIEKEYLQYRKNGGWLSFPTFAHQWLKKNKESISKAVDKND